MNVSELSGLATLVRAHVWQIGLLGLIVGGIAWCVGRRWPHLAYALWLVVLVKCFVPPSGNSPVDLLGRLTPVALTQPAVTFANVHDESTSPTVPTANANPAPRLVPRPPLPVTESDTRSAPPMTPLSGVPTAAVIWLIGSALLLGVAIGRGCDVGRRLRRSSRPLPPTVQAIADRVAARLQLPRGVRARATPTDLGPMVVGLWQPTVYLPQMLLTRMQPPQLEAMLAHELAHVRRRDTWVAALQFVAQTVWWFHPVVWWMNRELARQRERCCDEEAVVNLGGNRSAYARCLVDVLETRGRLDPLWGYPAVRPVELTRRRLEEIMNRKNMTHRRTPFWCWMVAALLAAIVLPSAAPKVLAEGQGEPATSVEKRPTAPPTDRPPTVLKYGDGKADGKISYGDSGHAIRFEMPKGVTRVRGIRIHGSRYGRSRPPEEDFEVEFVTDDLSNVVAKRTAPYRLFRRGDEKWVRVMFDEAVEVPPAFWVAINFNAHQTKGVYVSYDTSTKGQYSRKWLPGDEDEPQQTRFHGDWMVEALLTPPSQ